MSTPGRPRDEYRGAQYEGGPMSAPAAILAEDEPILRGELRIDRMLDAMEAVFARVAGGRR